MPIVYYPLSIVPYPFFTARYHFLAPAVIRCYFKMQNPKITIKSISYRVSIMNLRCIFSGEIGKPYDSGFDPLQFGLSLFNISHFQEVITMANKSQSQRSPGRGRPFQKGRSGNPKGRPKGSRNKTTIIAQALLDGQAEALVTKAVQLALEGDLTCLRICLERLVPMKKDAPFEISLPEIGAAADIPKLFAAVAARLEEGGITPSEARALIDLAEVYRKLIEVAELERRLTALEEKMKPGRQ